MFNFFIFLGKCLVNSYLSSDRNSFFIGGLVYAKASTSKSSTNLIYIKATTTLIDNNSFYLFKSSTNFNSGVFTFTNSELVASLLLLIFISERGLFFYKFRFRVYLMP